MNSFLTITTLLVPLVAAQGFPTTPDPSMATKAIDPALVGTWTTSSRQVFTGPGFYDPSSETMFEPSLTGFSYSFTSDGCYEEEY